MGTHAIGKETQEAMLLIARRIWTIVVEVEWNPIVDSEAPLTRLTRPVRQGIFPRI